MAHAAARGLVWIRRWRGAVSGVVCQFRIAGSVHFSLVTRIKSLRTPKKAVFDLKLIVGGGLPKVVRDKYLISVGSESTMSKLIGAGISYPYYFR